MGISRRRFCESVMAGAGLLRLQGTAGARTGSHLGSLYPFVQRQAERSPLELSFLRPEFKNLQQWQPDARARILEHLFYTPPRVAPQPLLVRRTDKGDYIEEYLTFQTTPDLRVPAYVLLPKQTRIRAPGLLVLHSHDGIYL